MIAISPSEALPILTNCIARGKPATGGALQALATSAPEMALPIILDHLQSVDPGKRRAAFRLLSHYPMTSTVESAMQKVAEDSDPAISKRAKEILTEKYQNEHPLESQFSGNPSYEGKLLGDWLKMPDHDGNYSEDAKHALQQMGTNAIPALLQRLVYVRPPFGLPAWEVNMEAVRGFITLGDQAVPALPSLETIMDGTNQTIVLYAMVSALGTGTNAIPVLSKGLTNTFAEVRSEAAHNLTEAVGIRFPECRNEIIPLLVKLLNDPDSDVRRNVRSDIQEIDPATAAKLGIK